MARGFDAAMRLMRSRDPQQQEDGFAQLRLHAAEHVAELIEQFERERQDQGLRRWLLELIAESGSPAALPVLVAQLDSADESLRGSATAGLTRLGTPEARSSIWRARANGTIT
ncbi:HEAT repeat domain-containing protein [Amycolatopsis sp. NEAU-NG30]|uniref:HEAT repeat domain-containing protein n=1 Tax=Amycolatopsis melonis TaxID=3156488 RepID=A0ABV0LA47_9PSEU